MPSMPKVRLSSGTIGTIRLPRLLSRKSVLSTRTNAIVVEIFEGPHFGSIFGLVMVALLAGGAAGPWLTGFIHDRTGNYEIAFILAIGLCAVGAFAIWRASPGKVRRVAGRS